MIAVLVGVWGYRSTIEWHPPSNDRFDVYVVSWLRMPVITTGSLSFGKGR
jgi:hypothetical protein